MPQTVVASAPNKAGAPINVIRLDQFGGALFAWACTGCSAPTSRWDVDHAKTSRTAQQHADTCTFLPKET
jgi:hypothetical protein